MKYINRKLFQKFLNSNLSGGILLILCVICSLIVANSPLSESFINLLDTKIGAKVGAIDLNYSILTWINDGLMAIFFLMVGLEIKREVVEGELSSFKKATLPIFAAMGGVLFPALIYTFFAHNTPYSEGWGIPVATDIAFALAVVMMLGHRVPPGLKIFLAALAIVDDLCAILIIAVFYNSNLDVFYLLVAIAIFIGLLIMNKRGVKNLWFYLIPGIIMWYLIHHSGVHATIAGVLTAFAIPTGAGKNGISPLEKLEHKLVNPVNFLIMPIFAFANTNIVLEYKMLEGITSPLGLGICFGLFFGKPLGIFIFSWISTQLKLSHLPKGVTWVHIAGAGILAGIGFTMSIFIAILSFSDAFILGEAKFFVLASSVLSGVFGFVFLSLYNKRRLKKEVE